MMMIKEGLRYWNLVLAMCLCCVGWLDHYIGNPIITIAAVGISIVTTLYNKKKGD